MLGIVYTYLYWLFVIVGIYIETVKDVLRCNQGYATYGMVCGTLF